MLKLMNETAKDSGDPPQMAKFENVSCSQCGQSFGPGEHGYSHCSDHGTEEVRVVFDGPPGPVTGRFVECENVFGNSISVGGWRERPDGLWEVVITPADFSAR